MKFKKTKKPIIALIIAAGAILFIILIFCVLYFSNLFHARNWLYKYIPSSGYSFADLTNVDPKYFPNDTLAKYEGLTDIYKDERGWFSVKLPKGWIVSKTQASNGFYASKDNAVYAVYIWSAKPEKKDAKQTIFTLDDFVKWRTATYEKSIMSEKSMLINGMPAVAVWMKGSSGSKNINIYIQGKDFRFYESKFTGPENIVDLYKQVYIYSLNTLQSL
ncbi:hypothetical protein HZA39_04780 [Candidatus Peregrinibacteria bacterium]|nr:hypothetical protein [Candidatus Peregrinibacteria bacterium]